MRVIVVVAVLVALLAVTSVNADLPIHCLNNQVAGDWEFTLSDDNHDSPHLCGYRAPDRSSHHLDGSYKYVLVPKKTIKLHLAEPNIVIGEGGKRGTWTMVYDEGFHVTYGDQQFFAFHRYKPKKGTPLDNIHARDYISFCGETLIGWFHGANNKRWGCYKGKQTKQLNDFAKRNNIPGEEDKHVYQPLKHSKPVVSPFAIESPEQPSKFDSKREAKRQKRKHRGHHPAAIVSPVKRDVSLLDEMFDPNYSFIEQINSDEESFWKAKAHEPFLMKTVRDMMKMNGAKKYNTPFRKFETKPEPAPVSLLEMDAHTNEMLAELQEGSQEKRTCEYGLPCSLDWRRKLGKDGKIVNWLSPIRNQGSCGSCYTMAFMAALESRVRIAHNDPHEQRFSPQHILACSVYNQGCDGGFPFLVGKHVEEFGTVREDCYLYQGRDSQCHHKCADKLEYPITNTSYVGGYFGACKEELMMRDLLEKGPMVLAFEAPGTLFSYHKGIFTGPKPKSEDEHVPGLNLWEHTNHAVVAVGWGSQMVKGQRVKYWIIRNTWGEHWGENGHMRIRRGTDECGIESMAVTFDVVKNSKK